MKNLQNRALAIIERCDIWLYTLNKNQHSEYIDATRLVFYKQLQSHFLSFVSQLHKSDIKYKYQLSARINLYMDTLQGLLRNGQFVDEELIEQTRFIFESVLHIKDIKTLIYIVDDNIRIINKRFPQQDPFYDYEPKAQPPVSIRRI